MDDGYVIVRLGALRDLIDLARTAADQLADREPDGPLVRCLRGAVAEVVTDLAEPVFS